MFFAHDHAASFFFLPQNMHLDEDEGMEHSSEVVAPMEEETVEVFAHEEEDEF